MKELVILSGKGGTGKTSVTAAFAAIAENKILCDADVDAADLHLLADPDFNESFDFMGGGLAVIDPKKCSQCGRCVEVCRFDAIDAEFQVDEIACEGCGVCVDLCPEAAIDFPPQKCGEWFISNSRLGRMVHARLGIAQENSGKLVALIRNQARMIAEEKKMDLILTDGPPGVGCPVIASLGGASRILIVSEPTVSGIHDMKRVAELARHFKIPAMVCVNKFDLNMDQTQAIKDLAKLNQIDFVGVIPFDPVVTEAMVNGKTVVEYEKPSEAAPAIRGIWDEVIKKLD